MRKKDDSICSSSNIHEIEWKWKRKVQFKLRWICNSIFEVKSELFSEAFNSFMLETVCGFLDFMGKIHEKKMEYVHMMSKLFFNYKNLLKSVT